jgi:hypothetical protein
MLIGWFAAFLYTNQSPLRIGDCVYVFERRRKKGVTSYGFYLSVLPARRVGVLTMLDLR